MKTLCSTRRGAALIIVLGFIVMLTIIVVGLLNAMRVERSAASSHFEKERATLLAQQAVESVVATLNKATGNPNLYWISQPGQVIVYQAGTATSTNPSPTPTPSPCPLSSGLPTITGTDANTPSYFLPPNLNIATLQDPTTHLITESSDSSSSTAALPMKVKWVYVRRDGTLDTAERPVTTNASNPIVGRYAYWTDDESSKINYNLAWTRGAENVDANGNPTPLGNPTKVDLTALQDTTNPAYNVTSTIADAIHRYITIDNYLTTYNFFNTPEDARGVPSAVNSLKYYKFEVTHFNHDPNTTFFNEPRIVLTTRPDRAGWTYDSVNKVWVGKNGKTGKDGTPHYLRILLNEGDGTITPATIPAAGSALDPGLTSAASGTLDPAKFPDTMNLLLSYLQRADWPMVDQSGSGQKSFQAKYFSGYPNFTSGTTTTAGNQGYRLIQLAINIIDYVRSKESPQPIVLPLRVTGSSSGGSLSFQLGDPANYQGDQSFIGQSRAPFLNEFGLWFKKGVAANGLASYTPYIQAELYIPKTYNIPLITDLSVFDFGIDWVNADGSGYSAPTDGTWSWPTTGTRITTANGYSMTATVLGGTLDANQYVTVIHLAGAKAGISAPLATNYPWRWRVYPGAYVAGTEGRFDLVPLSQGNTITGYDLPLATDSSSYGSVNTTVKMAGGTLTTMGNINSWQTDDPRTNGQTAYNGQTSASPAVTWKQAGSTFYYKDASGNVYGGPNSAVLTIGGTPSATLVPPQDVDSNSKISNASLYMPAPAGVTTGVLTPNPTGYVTSVGELGYIHTGNECNNEAYLNPYDSTSPVVALPAAVPWRTLHLQPNSYADTSTVPDWALMDLFTVPVVVNPNAGAVYAPHDTAIGGRVNLNSAALPFGMQRVLPLAAAFQGCPTTTSGGTATAPASASLALTIAQNIYAGSLATNGKYYGRYTDVNGNAAHAYISPGEVCEVKGVADGGEASEELVRQIGNLTTVRGGVYSVYSVGQSIKQTITGALQVTGEQRVQAMVERKIILPATSTSSPTPTPSTTPPPDVGFRTVYCRNLMP